MNKYQEYAFKQIKLSCISKNQEKAEIKVVDDKINIKQHENYNIVKYDLVFTGKNIEKVEYYTNKWNDSVIYNDDAASKKIPIDFNCTPPKVKITFVGGLVDPIELKIIYLLADKKAWDKKFNEQTIEDYKSNLNLLSLSGNAIFKTLFFKPCSDSCKKTVIEWYVVNEERKQIKDSNGRFIQKRESIYTKYFLCKEEITDNRCFSNSPSIANDFIKEHYIGTRTTRKIEYILKQYDVKGDLLIEVPSSEILNNV